MGDDAIAYANRGYALMGMGGASQLAIPDFDKAIQLDPDYAWAYANRGSAHLNLRQFAEYRIDKAKACSLDKRFCYTASP